MVPAESRKDTKVTSQKIDKKGSNFILTDLVCFVRFETLSSPCFVGFQWQVISRTKAYVDSRSVWFLLTDSWRICWNTGHFRRDTKRPAAAWLLILHPLCSTKRINYFRLAFGIKQHQKFRLRHKCETKKKKSAGQGVDGGISFWNQEDIYADNLSWRWNTGEHGKINVFWFWWGSEKRIHWDTSNHLGNAIVWRAVHDEGCKICSRR